MKRCMEKNTRSLMLKIIFVYVLIGTSVFSFSSIHSYVTNAALNEVSGSSIFNPKVGFFVAFLTFFLNYIYDLAKSSHSQNLSPAVASSDAHLERYPVHAEPLDDDLEESMQEELNELQADGLSVEDQNAGPSKASIFDENKHLGDPDEEDSFGNEFDLEKELYDEELFGTREDEDLAYERQEDSSIDTLERSDFTKNQSNRDERKAKRSAESNVESSVESSLESNAKGSLERDKEEIQWKDQEEFLKKLNYTMELQDFQKSMPSFEESAMQTQKYSEMELWDEDDFDILDDFEKFDNQEQGELKEISEDDFSENDLQELYNEIREEKLFSSNDEDLLGLEKLSLSSDEMQVNELEGQSDDLKKPHSYEDFDNFNENLDLEELRKKAPLRGLFEEEQEEGEFPKSFSIENQENQENVINLDAKVATGDGRVIESYHGLPAVKVLDSDDGEMIFENIAATEGTYTVVVFYRAIIASSIEVFVNGEWKKSLEIYGEGDPDQSLQATFQVALQTGLNHIQLRNESYQNIMVEKLMLNFSKEENAESHGVA